MEGDNYMREITFIDALDSYFLYDLPSYICYLFNVPYDEAQEVANRALKKFRIDLIHLVNTRQKSLSFYNDNVDNACLELDKAIEVINTI